MKLLISQVLDGTNTMQYSEVYMADVPFKYIRNSFVKSRRAKRTTQIILMEMCSLYLPKTHFKKNYFIVDNFYVSYLYFQIFIEYVRTNDLIL